MYFLKKLIEQNTSCWYLVGKKIIQYSLLCVHFLCQVFNKYVAQNTSWWWVGLASSVKISSLCKRAAKRKCWAKSCASHKTSSMISIILLPGLLLGCLRTTGLASSLSHTNTSTDACVLTTTIKDVHFYICQKFMPKLK